MRLFSNEETQIGLPGVILGTTIVSILISLLLMPNATAIAMVIAVFPVWLSIRWFFETQRGTRATWVDRVIVAACVILATLIVVLGLVDVVS